MMFSLYIVELAILSALLSLFLEFCFREGNIFGWWLDYLLNTHLPTELQNETREVKEEAITWWWYKPLGGCIVCMNVWISFFMCVMFFQDLRFIVVVLLSNFIVRYFYERLL